MREQARRKLMSGIALRVAQRALGVLCAGLLIVSPLSGDPRWAAPQVSAEARPYNTALLVSADEGASIASIVTDGSALGWIDARGAIYVRTLADGRETRVLDGPASRSQLVIGNGLLAWIERGQGSVTVRGLRLGSDPFTIATGTIERNSPAISDNTIVWREAAGGAWQIAGYDLGTQRALAITTTPAARGTVAIADTTIAWEEFRNGRWTLISYDLNTRQEGTLTTGADEYLDPALGGGAAVFVRRVAGKTAGALVLRDLRSGQERVIAAEHLLMRPRIAGDLVVWEDWRDGVPNIYAFDRASGKEFALARTEDARLPAIGGTVVAWIGRGQFSARVTAVRLVKSLPSDPQDAPTVSDPDVRYFAETRHSTAGAFRQFWSINGGLAVFGYPLTEAFEETTAGGTKRQVQYFERAKLEANSQDTKQIALARLGAEITNGRPFPTITAFDSTDERAYFPQTGHGSGGWFLQYWRDRGGVNVFGFPISEEVVENGRTVQYFERARFEFVPTGTDAASGIALGQIGREALVKLGWLAPEQKP
jgi:beta propeller repeat protein